MRFCLSLTLHYLILHLTGSASFADDPFYKYFSQSFFGLEVGSFSIYLAHGNHNMGPHSYVWHRLSAFTRCKYKFAVFPALFRDLCETYENIFKKQWERKEVLAGGLSL